MHEKRRNVHISNPAASATDDWYVVATLRAGDQWDDAEAVRGVYGPFTEERAVAGVEKLRGLHPDRSFGMQRGAPR
jgi:hypothetical protein